MACGFGDIKKATVIAASLWQVTCCWQEMSLNIDGQMARRASIREVYATFLGNLLALATVILQSQAVVAHDARIPIQQGIRYSNARILLLSSGWQAYYNSGIWRGLLSPLQRKFGKLLINADMHEYWGCSGTGINICYMLFTNQDGNILQVAIVGGMEPNSDSPVHSWRFVQDTPSLP